MSKIYTPVLMLFSVLCMHIGYAQTTANDVWNAYTANPDNHPNIPNCSYAGYRTGNVSLPNPSSTVYNVKNAPYNAVGNGTTDDAPAIQAAIDAAGAAGGGIVSIPAGTYLLNNFLHIKYSNVVLRGAGRDATTLDFAKSLQSIKGDFITEGSDYSWWWSGGLIWIGPANTFDGSGKVAMPFTYTQSWEYWRGGSVITTVSGTATRGAKTVTVASASGLSAGMKVLMTWESPTDKSLIKHIYGHVPTEGAIDSGSGGVGSSAALITPIYPRFQWAVEIASVSGNQVTLVQPLRIDIRTNWNVRFEQTGSVITESGVENLRVKGHAPMTHTHLAQPTATVGGWNGVYINRSWNCWTKDVAVTSMENGVILAAAKNVTIKGVLIDGPEQNHHSFACRVNSHDNLFEDYAVNGPKRVRHGINIEWLSSGNVWSRGIQKAGTFDSHRALSFDLIRTECTVANDGGSVPGGGGEAGPYIGRRSVIWNVLEYIDPSYGLQDGSSRSGDDIHEPRQYVMGALVGVRGQPLNTSEGEIMPPGDKGTLVADDGIVPSILNLYEAQKNFRANPGGNTAPTVSITSPANNATFTSGSNITITANASDSDGTISKVEFYNGATKIGEDSTSPYSIVWNSVVGGIYTITAKASDNATVVTTSAAITITVGDPSTYRNPENPSNTVNGLQYSYYEGSWTAIPDFTTLTPVETGTTYNFYTSLKNRDHQFAFKFTGYINIPSPGEYTFYTTSKDGSKLYIGSTLVVNNDGQHNEQERSGTIGLKAGKHAITVAYFEQNAEDYLVVRYSGPSLAKTTIPSTSLYRVSTNPSEDNLAFNRPTAASNNQTSALTSPNAVDGNPGSRWSTLFTNPHWIYVDLGAVYNITRVKLYWESHGKDYKIQVSNDLSSWTDIKTVTGNTVQYNDLTGLSGSGRYVRMYGTARGTMYGFSLFEFEVYGTSGSSSNVLPTVNITSPSNNASFTAGSNITINASASDSDGTISKVEFYNGSTKLGEDTSSPYSYTWNSVVAGTYLLTANATDNSSGVTTSSTITITVTSATNVTPTASITSPANNATFTAGSNITINANAADSDGTITKVEFFEGSNKLGEDTSSPYSYTWNSVVAGSYSLTAKATDNVATTTTSSIINITVGTAPVGYAIPGKVEAENFSAMSGIQTEGTSDTGGGQNVGWIEAGDWMDYSVNVATAGTYTINYRVASQAGGGKITLRKGAIDYHTVDVPNTGAWQTWTTVSASATLDAGAQTLRVYATAAGFNLNWFEGVTGSISTLRNPENPANTVNGLDYSYYEGNWSALPDFTALTAAETGTVTNFDLTPRNRNDQFAFKYTGYVNVAVDGDYTFYTSSDDGSKLLIGTTLVVNNDGLHGAQERSGTIGLKAGKHALTVTLFEQGGGELLSVSYAGPSLTKTVIPATALYRSTGGREVTESEVNADSEALMVHPNPATNTLYISAKDVKSVVLYNVQGVAVIRPTSNYHTVDISSIPAGMYLLKVKTSKAVHTRKVLKQ